MPYFDTILDRILEDIEGKLPRAIQTLLSKKSRWLKRQQSQLKKRADQPELSRERAAEMAEAIVRDVAQWDPTSNQKYIQYIVQQVALAQIRFPEDGPHIRDALAVFDKRKGNWTGEKDIFKYKNWRDLQGETTKYTSENNAVEPITDYMGKWRKLSRESSKVLFVKDILTTKGVIHYKAVECHGWASATLMGLGSQWCTSATPFRKDHVNKRGVLDIAKRMHDTRTSTMLQKSRGKDIPECPFWPNFSKRVPDEPDQFGAPEEDDPIESYVDYIYRINGMKEDDATEKSVEMILPNPYFQNAMEYAKEYLEPGPVYVIFKANKPYIQMASTGVDIRGTNDESLATAGGATAIILQEVLKHIGEPTGPGLANHIKRILSDSQELKAQSAKVRAFVPTRR